MVLAERNGDELTTRNGRRSRGASPAINNGHFSDEDSTTDESEHDSGMRVGEDYQAHVPDFPVSIGPCPEFAPERALLVWSPCPEISDNKLDEYIILAKEKYGYNAEQALGMLFWHKYDLEKALADLPNFTPFPDEWTVEDKVLFEQAFQFHGKSFHKIRQMLPDKSISSLVKYYYSWKKTRTRTSLMDRQARKMSVHQNENSDAGSEPASENDSDIETENGEGKEESPKSCSNCGACYSQLFTTSKGILCNGCYQYWRRTGMMRSAGGPMKKHESTSARHNPMRSKRKPPRGMYLSHEDLVTIATGPPNQAENILRSLDLEIVSLKRQVQNNKQIVSQLKHKTSAGINEFKPNEVGNRMNARWTHEELLLAVQGVRKYGKDFKAIAEVIGNKNEAHVRNFFANYRRRFNLDAVIKEYEAEHGITTDDQDKDEKMAIEQKGTTSPDLPVQTPPTNNGAISGPPPPLVKPSELLAPVQPVSKPYLSSVPQLSPRSTPPKNVLHQPPPLVRPAITPTKLTLHTKVESQMSK
ncbi:REST corepressor 1-like isoform X1 [Tachypleus tridentatus]|uniref:REST corepressor 1-like isoform X1 n=2 Tax=Tachypleus tridentatus TaxID=6853 RepID=UPI003FD28EED